MTDEIMVRYSEFVNRESELKRFCKILEANEYIVMVIYGEQGIGKTSLQKRLIYECREVRKMRWAETFFLDTRSYNYMTLMRKVRDDIGPEFFLPFTDLLNYFTKPNYDLTINVPHAGAMNTPNNADTSQPAPAINILTGDPDLDNVKIGEINATKVVIQDLNINTPREDKEIQEEERMFKLTQQFLTDLVGALGDDQIVILIDDVEKMPPETSKWLWSELVRAVLDRKVENIRFVLCIDDAPKLDEYMERRVQSGPLKLLSEEHIVDYLKRRNVGLETERRGMATMIMAAGGVKPSEMARIVKVYLDMQKNREES